MGGGPRPNESKSCGYITYGFVEDIENGHAYDDIGEELIFDFSWYPLDTGNSRYFCTAGYDGFLRIFEISINDDQKISIVETISEDTKQGLNQALFTKDGKYIITSGIKREILIYEFDLENKIIININSLAGHRARVRKCSIENKKNNQFSIASCSSDSTVRIWPEPLKYSNQSIVLTGHSNFVRDVLYANSIIISTARDGKINFWNAQGEALNSFHVFTGWGRSLCMVDKFIIASGDPNRLVIIDHSKVKNCATETDNINTNIPNDWVLLRDETKHILSRDGINNIDKGKECINDGYSIVIVDCDNNKNRTTVVLYGQLIIKKYQKKENNLLSKGFGSLRNADDGLVNSHTEKRVIWPASDIHRCSLKYVGSHKELRCILLNIHSEANYQVFNNVAESYEPLFEKPMLLERPFYLCAAETYPVISCFSDCGNLLVVLYEDLTCGIWSLHYSKPTLIFFSKLSESFFNKIKDKDSISLRLFRPENGSFYQLECAGEFTKVKEKKKLIVDIETTLPFWEIALKLSKRSGIRLQNSLRHNHSPYLISNFLDQDVSFKITYRIGDNHETEGFEYKHNYGELCDTNIRSGDNDILDVHLITNNGPAQKDVEYTGRCIGYVHRINDIEDKIIVIPVNEVSEFTRENIHQMLDYYETNHWDVIFYFSDNFKP